MEKFLLRIILDYESVTVVKFDTVTLKWNTQQQMPESNGTLSFKILSAPDLKVRLHRQAPS